MKSNVTTLLLALLGYLALNTAVYFLFSSLWQSRVAISYVAMFAFISGIIFYVALVATKKMDGRGAKILSGAVGALVIISFILGLAYSISSGFAGFWGGFPFWCIAITVLTMAVYDFWDECIRRKNNP